MKRTISLLAVVLAGLLLLCSCQIVGPDLPETYAAGGVTVDSITAVAGRRTLDGITQSLTGDGKMESGLFSYSGADNAADDVAAYVAELTEEYGASVEGEYDPLAESGSIQLTVPGETAGMSLTITYGDGAYEVLVEQMAEAPKPVEEPEEGYPISADDAMNLLLTLTKIETGFSADISVYTKRTDEQLTTWNGVPYYVITVVADYEDGRPEEYRGTFYVSAEDGAILRYDLETDTAEQLRNGQRNTGSSTSSSGSGLSAEGAMNRLLTLSRSETGFSADISVYTRRVEETLVNYNGRNYYVITVVADYEDGRPEEYRGTFYVAQDGGEILRYDLDTDTAEVIRSGS